MSLSYMDQIGLLKDIMMNHLEDLQGSTAECSQMGRLIKSLLANQEIHHELAPVLEEIYYYCQKGFQTADLGNHIGHHHENLSQWLADLEQYS